MTLINAPHTIDSCYDMNVSLAMRLCVMVRVFTTPHHMPHILATRIVMLLLIIINQISHLISTAAPLAPLPCRPSTPPMSSSFVMPTRSTPKRHSAKKPAHMATSVVPPNKDRLRSGFGKSKNSFDTHRR